MSRDSKVKCFFIFSISETRDSTGVEIKDFGRYTQRAVDSRRMDRVNCRIDNTAEVRRRISNGHATNKLF